MGNLIFKDNTQAMYNKILELAPKPFKAMTKQQMDQTLVETFGENGEVTEDKFIEIVKAKIPKAFIQVALNALEPLISKTP
ncbi:MAG: hypothetical protein A2042_05810 [Candidatus Schekmanbacteria bacterium GWA2_38_11]|uniref:Uncharacterized protein n=1 Tax=Candidatus Schekmanbacteria bacterium GWA2_38_11 TaxID=1817876 RepID=A0A1F7REJ1_9BACT|nr:MAG: hypothetical protein A2042_05810 [Candidatus Schekmanbacteria bacterium GWA2_38_11]